jgi:hypothetical protein
MKNCDEHVVGINDKHMKHNEKVIAKYMLTFGLDDSRNLFPLQNDESHTQEKGSNVLLDSNSTFFFAKGLTIEGCLSLGQITPSSHSVAQNLVEIE